jgi:hypothetical protein
MITLTATIASGNSKSHALYLGAYAVVLFGALYYNEVAAPFTFEISQDGQTWRDLQVNGTLLQTVSNPSHVAFETWWTRPHLYLRVVSGVPGREIAQTAGDLTLDVGLER